MTIFAKTSVPSESEIQDMAPHVRVNRGIRLQRIAKRANDELEKLKIVFRAAAEERRIEEPELSPVQFLGTVGSAKVVFKGDSLKPIENKKAIGLKDVLPPELFHNLFNVETVALPVKDFKDKVENLPEEHKTSILKYFKEVPNTPSVEFSK